MKRMMIVISLLVAFVAMSASAFTNVTQSASAVEKDLPRIEFYKQINDAVSAITKTDLPATIALVNKVKSGKFTNGQAVVTFTGAFAVAPRVLVYSTDATSIGNTLGGTNRAIFFASAITASNFVPLCSSAVATGIITNGAYIAITD